MAISKEEADLIRPALKEFDEQFGVHEDAAEDAAQFGPSLEAIASMLETVNERLNKLESIVMDDIVGGITSLYQKNKRDSSIGELKTKYGTLFDPHKNAIDAFYPGVDIFEKLQDLKDEMSGKEDYSDEAFDGSVQAAVKELQDKIAQLTGKQDQDGGAAVEPTVEVEIEKEGGDAKSEEGSLGDDELANALEKLKGFKKKFK